jgi:deoxyribose-phosphate aldolase
MTPELPRPLASYVDHTLLRPDATGEEVLRVVAEAAEHRFAAVFIPPCYVAEAAATLESRAEAGPGRAAVALGTAIAFPFGWADPRIRLEEARRAVDQGARELDTVINVSRVKSGDWGHVRDDLAGWVEALRATEEELVLKVILETALLTDEEKERAAELVVEAGADFVKTSTGFAARGATVEDVKLLAEAVKGRIKVKASGGIRDAETALAMIEAGADRIGTSTGVQILKGWERSRREAGD